jgi:hypothetical protein
MVAGVANPMLLALQQLAFWLPSDATAPHPGPHAAYASFDCKLRALALEFAQDLQPFRGKDEIQEIADALNGATYAECRNLTAPEGLPAPSPPAFSLPSGPASGSGEVFVDYAKGSDTAAGTEAVPLKTIAAALAKASAKTIVLRGGTHYLNAPLELTAKHSGLSLMNFPKEEVFISGAVPLPSANLHWRPAAAGGGRVMQADLSSVPGLPAAVLGLRVGGVRAIRARYPNWDPEQGFGPGLTVGGPPGRPHSGPNGTGEPTYRVLFHCLSSWFYCLFHA